MNVILNDILNSRCTISSKQNIDDILCWVKDRNALANVKIIKQSLSTCSGWKEDTETKNIKNINGGFFSIKGLVENRNGKIIEQPIIIQSEIGYLGFICKKINGILKFLVQAKIEPGNINNIQLSPTIQATKSNFLQKHGGKKPSYLEYFLNAEKYHIIVDQIQSEQGQRFYKKRNRNIIIYVDDEIEVLPSHRWLTLYEIKQMMKIDNLINMDTRTVLSCLPLTFLQSTFISSAFNFGLINDKELFNSIISPPSKNDFVKVYRYINNLKMFDTHDTKIINLKDVKSWEYFNNEYICKDNASFKMIFCNISIDGREVKEWHQPLFEANGKASFILFTKVFDDKRKFLVHPIHESGSFDVCELGPTIQLEVGEEKNSTLRDEFINRYNDKKNILCDVVLSEEGGRFYHEENNNIIIEVSEDFKEPDGYFWLDFSTLNYIMMINNTLNIQLRNLLSLLEL